MVRSQQGSRENVHVRTVTPIVETCIVNSFNTLLDAEGEEEIGGHGGPGPNG